MAQPSDGLEGRSLAHYQIVGKLGQGGMGEVYRAQDSKLGRGVALKLLPAAFAQDPERVARFRREARTLASLQHPHIASIFGFEESGDQRFLVMELVEGEDLAQRVRRGAVPVEETLGIARQMAEGIEAAHDKGIVHRDLKPANVKLTADGSVKILDFGLARAYLDDGAEGGDPASSPTLTAQMTHPGVILGTAAYMSPEQARGRTVDRRADIWAYGVILFELLTGAQLFEGETVSDTLASVLRTDIDWGRLPRETPPAVGHLLRRCLERNPKLRLRDIGEARILLENVAAGRAGDAFGGAASGAGAAPASPRRKGAWGPLALGVVLGGLAVGAVAWSMRQPPPVPPLRKFELLGGEALTASAESPAISPDGSRIAFVSGGRLWLRELDQLEPRELANTAGAMSPFWAPDGTTIGYLLPGKVMKIPAGGGEPVTVCDAGAPITGGHGGTWTEDGRILFSRGDEGGVLEVPARGGDPRSLVLPDTTTEGDLHEPYALPGGKGILYIAHVKGKAPNTLKVWANGRARELYVGGEQRLWNPVYSPTGHILFRREEGNPGIWALPFSLERLERAGDPFLAVPNGHSPSVARDATLACTRHGAGGNLQLVRRSRDGSATTPIGPLQRLGHWFDVSPDGTRLVVDIDDGENTHIWSIDLVRGTQTRLTFDRASHSSPAWAPDGDRVVYVTGRDAASFAITLQAADGTDQPRKLTVGWGPTFTPDGRTVVYAAPDPKSSWDVWTLSLAAGAQPVRVVNDPAWQYAARVSPDGRALAYVSRETGQDEVYLKRFPSGEGKWQVSVRGGCWPRWSRRGDRLFYMAEDDLMEVDVQLAAGVTLGQPRKVFTREPLGVDTPNSWPTTFSVSPDGSEFYLIYNADRRTGRSAITVVQNWFAEFQSAR